jgi:hypothetical protein
MATSSATTIGYFDTDGDIVSLSEDYTKTGLGDYYLVCGYNEFDKRTLKGSIICVRKMKIMKKAWL